ncbi:MAG: ABC transporter ATP-binding protein [Oscillospiraceae bacterium]
MIEIQNVTKKFGKFTAIDSLNFTVEDGSIYGLIGYNGAGKTTLLKTITGVYRADGGEVRLDGENAFDNAKMKQHMFYVPDEIYFEPYANMEKMAKFYNGYYPDFSFDTFKKLAEVFGLDTKARLNGFSKGMQRQAEIVLGFATHPSFMLFDETFDGLDPAKRSLIKNMINEYLIESHASVIVSSHDLHELEGLCDHFGLINGKKLVMNSSIEELSSGRAKFRLIFTKPITEDQIKALGIDVKSFKIDGQMIILTTKGDENETEQKLTTLSPVMLEKLSLTLEEVFLDEMEGTDYDFSKVF